jgi:pyruvate dehydrogenase E2 component (dihydrolipoamide acetyltransferase)
MEFGTVIAWHTAAGDHVKRGDIVAEVDTDKSVIDVETFTTGTVEEILVAPGERVPVGTPLAVIREDAATLEPGGPLIPAVGRVPPPGPTPESPGHRPAASPLARRHAAKLGVDLTDVPGTGPGGAVTTSDVDRFAVSQAGRPGAPAAAAVPTEGVPSVPAVSGPTDRPVAAPLSGVERQAALRRSIAMSMARSKREIPHYYLACDVDMSHAVHWLDEQNAVRAVTDRLLPVVLLVKATALALHETPELNGFWESDAFRPAGGVHVGVAVALRGGGLVAPALMDTDHLTLAQLMAGLRDLVARARTGRLRSSEVSHPTITVTSLGDQGVDVVQPVIYPPQVAIVGFGRIRERPWAVAGMLGVRPVVTATLAADHRVSDGHRGAVFLTALDHLLQTPEEL